MWIRIFRCDWNRTTNLNEPCEQRTFAVRFQLLYMKKYLSTSEKETMAVARRFAGTLRGGEVVLLEGDLGAGKTTFVRGLARAFGIKEPIRSPTFNLMKVYKINKKVIASGAKQSHESKVALKFTGSPRRARISSTPRDDISYLVHVDAYRLRGAADLRAIGLEEYSGRKDTIVLIEWGEKVKSLFNKNAVRRILFSHASAHNTHRIIYGIARSTRITKRRTVTRRTR